jgi:hypothetical protein
MNPHLSRLFFLVLLNIAAGNAQAAILSLADLAPGDLQITEYLPDPSGVADSQGEYFEIFNRRNEPVDLGGLVVRDEGSNSFTVAGLTAPARGFVVLGNGTGGDLGFVPDYAYGGAMSLTNTDDEILLVGPDDRVLMALRYSAGNFFGAGVALELVAGDRSGAQALGPDLGSDYAAATTPLPLGNFGSPGRAGGTLFDAPVVPLPAAGWLFGSALLMLLRARRMG